MIINGGARRSGTFYTKHLGNRKENNRVDVIELRGLAAADLKNGFQELKSLASIANVKDPFYVANINPKAHERLTPEQWDRALEILEKHLGLTDHARIVVEHEKNGRIHRHVAWSLFNHKNGRAVGYFNDWFKCQAAAKEIEREFGLEPVKGREKQRHKGWEVFRGKKSGIDPRSVALEVSELWRQADSGTAFQAALEQHGYILARGDRRDYCLVDEAGDIHSLARRIKDASAADVRLRLADIDRDTLLSVQQAAELQKERLRLKTAALDKQIEDVQPFLEHQEQKQQERTKQYQDRKARPAPAPTAAKETERAVHTAQKGFSATVKLAGGVTQSLSKFLDSALDFFIGKPPVRDFSPAELAQSPSSRREFYSQQQAAQERDEALDHISADIKAKRNLSAADLRALSTQDFHNLKAHGDGYLLTMIRRREEELEKAQKRRQGRERQR